MRMRKFDATCLPSLKSEHEGQVYAPVDLLEVRADEEGSGSSYSTVVTNWKSAKVLHRKGMTVTDQTRLNIVVKAYTPPEVVR